MKKRYLRKSIQTTLEVVTFLLVAFLCMVEDFSLSFIPVLLLVCAVTLCNICILNKYAKY